MIRKIFQLLTEFSSNIFLISLGCGIGMVIGRQMALLEFSGGDIAMGTFFEVLLISIAIELALFSLLYIPFERWFGR